MGLVEGVRMSGYTQWRRGGRVVECGGLENRYVGNPGVGGSNPPLSARIAGQLFSTPPAAARQLVSSEVARFVAPQSRAKPLPVSRVAKRWPGEIRTVGADKLKC
jgi:hypothetical protein